MPARAVTALSLASCLLTALAAAGCGNSSSAGADPPALTKAQAQQALASFTEGANRAGRRLDRVALRGIEVDPQLSMDTASFRLRRVVRQRPPVLRLGQVAYYIPRMHGYPRWFAADAATGSGKQTVRHALLFTQAKAGAPWLLAADPYPMEAALSRVALDPDGFATPVDPGSKGLAVTPAALPGVHARLLTEGPGASGVSVLADGPRTHQTFEALRDGEQALAKRGITLSSRFSAAPYGVYALRTRDRGALVWYVLKQNEAYSAPNRGTLAVSGDLVGLAPARATRNRMDTTVLVQYLATVPPKGRVTVGGMYRKAVALRGS
ncbi:hypothetical protein AGRA3207_002894 [Actinomadura graeca]|uniref:DUF8094 domain-containing protein n=1 Tax=Actinomadura graeca TaxID=2750812 RepID=A0ABX8QT34_9ACTN|nr:hypothetical protein [Actinomadura graeca]QXJ21974.1 hypothetical protein AGRA3207_002894 [Actinomadura graeca]